MKVSRISSFLHLLAGVGTLGIISATSVPLPLLAQAEPKAQKAEAAKGGDETRRVMLVLDASGSMWGKVEGRAKIEIAREVVREFVQALPADVEMGLVAYGHRTKGDCKDIELLLPVGKLDKNKFIKTVDGLQPKGMTPLTDAVEFAAEAMRFDEQQASVILVTDGEETCHRDPCDAATKLEALGVNFTAHVIAFDLEDKAARSIQCLAENTGGRFLKADNAASLADALFIAIESETQAPAPEEEPAPEPEASLTVPETAVAGSQVSVEWKGPGNAGDYITFVPDGKPHGSGINYAYTRQGSPLEITGLIEPVKAEALYISGRSGKVLGRAPITFVPAEYSLKAADTAVAGSPVSVEWTGPNNKGDYLTIVEKGVDDNSYAKFQYTTHGSPASVEAPLKVGTAEIRYVSGQKNEVMARRDITITEATISLKAPDTVQAGGMVEVEWTGPNNKSDYITIVTKGTADASYAKYKYTSYGSPAQIEAPLSVGEMEIRYVSGQNKVLARRPLTTTEVSATLKAPGSAEADADVSIEWTGPNNKGDYITIVPKGTRDGAYASYTYTERGNPVTVKTPPNPGPAEIRYMSGQGDKVITRLAIELTPSSKEN